MQIRGWERGIVVGVAVGLAAGSGCGDLDRGEAPVAVGRLVQAPEEPIAVMRPLAAGAAIATAPDTGLVFQADLTVDARLLVITADGSNAAFAAITSTLDYLGTPYDVLNATTSPLGADQLASGEHGKYQGILLDLGDLQSGSTSAFSDAEWMALSEYEARFGVRRAAFYTPPGPAYGLTAGGRVDAGATPIAVRCTAAGAAVFVGLNCAAPLSIAAGWAYPARAADGDTTGLLADDAGNLYAATRRYPDGREALALTFSQSSTAVHTLALAYGVVSWVTRGIFIGEKHAFASAQIDDLFLPSALFTGGKYRATDADYQALADWQNGWRASPLTANLRLAWAFNGYGSTGAAADPLTAKALALGPAFAFINHTWDHLLMDNMSYTDAMFELSRNDQLARDSGLPAYDLENLVTPGISGLGNPAAMQAAYDFGIRHLVSDTSVAGEDNPSPNCGFYNAQVGGLLEIPRRPTNLYFNVSLPAEWEVEYQMLHGKTRTYDEIVASESDVLLRYLLRGENDPWMFHQANIRDHGGGHSLLSDLLEAALGKYAAVATLPVLSPTMDELAHRVADRTSLHASGVTATLQPGGQLVVQVTNAAKVPITGVCTPGAETYAGQRISYLRLAAGQSVTLSLAGCNDGAPGTGPATDPNDTGPRPGEQHRFRDEGIRRVRRRGDPGGWLRGRERTDFVDGLGDGDARGSRRDLESSPAKVCETEVASGA